MIAPTIEAVIAAATEAGDNDHVDGFLLSDPGPEWSAFAAAKLRDALVAGFEPEFNPYEAEAAGAFLEDALLEEDARETSSPLPRFHPAVPSPKA